MVYQIERVLLEKTVKELIETILFCLPQAGKGTLYSIGKPPDLIAERVISGTLNKQKNEMIWNLTDSSFFDHPGLAWNQYREEPGRAPQSLAWCVIQQQGKIEESPVQSEKDKDAAADFHYFEPVLVAKSTLDLDVYPSVEYPRDYQNNAIWKESDQAVVAVVKITFHSGSLKPGPAEIQIIKKLTHALGTKLLSFQLRQDSISAMQQLTKERLYACNILADSLRNAITKSGLIFSLIKQEIGYLRKQWEDVLFAEFQKTDPKKEAIQGLDALLLKIKCNDQTLIQNLSRVQSRFLELSLPPEKGKNWVLMQIESRWGHLLECYPQAKKITDDILKNLDSLKSALFFGLDPELIEKYDKVSVEFKKEWINLIYQNFDKFNPSVLNKIIKLLENKSFQIESRERSCRRLVQLKALAETMNQLEHNTNFLLQQVLNGGTESLVTEYINRFHSSIQAKETDQGEYDSEPVSACFNS